MKLLACSLIVLFNIVRFFYLVFIDIEGRPEQPPTGFIGFIATVVSMTISIVLFYYAGVYDIFIEMIGK